MDISIYFHISRIYNIYIDIVVVIYIIYTICTYLFIRIDEEYIIYAHISLLGLIRLYIIYTLINKLDIYYILGGGLVHCEHLFANDS